MEGVEAEDRRGWRALKRMEMKDGKSRNPSGFYEFLNIG